MSTSSSNNSSLKDVLNQFFEIIKDQIRFYYKIGNVSDVNKDEYTFTFNPLDDTAQVLDVKMKTIASDGRDDFMIIVPKEGSTCIVAFESPITAYCIMVKECEEWLVTSDLCEFNFEEWNATSEIATFNIDECNANSDDCNYDFENWEVTSQETNFNINTWNLQSDDVNYTITNKWDIDSPDTTVSTNSWVYNGGANDGLIKINDLTDKLNSLKDTVNQLIQKFNVHTHGGVQSGGSLTLTTTPSQSQAATFNKNDYENPIIKH